MNANETSNPKAVATELRRSMSRIHGLFALGRPKGELSTAKFTALGILLRGGPMTASALAARQGIRPQSLTRVLAELELDGLVTRTRGTQDARETVVAKTAKAVTILREEGNRRDSALREVMERALSPVEIDFLQLAAKTLNKLADCWGPASEPGEATQMPSSR